CVRQLWTADREQAAADGDHCRPEQNLRDQRPERLGDRGDAQWGGERRYGGDEPGVAGAHGRGDRQHLYITGGTLNALTGASAGNYTASLSTAGNTLAITQKADPASGGDGKKAEGGSGPNS